MHPRFLIVLLCLSACATTVKHPVPPALTATLAPPTDQQRSYANVIAHATFAATGDLLLHETVKASAIAANIPDDQNRSTNHEGFDSLFEGIAPLIRKADYAFANLATPVAPKNNRRVRSTVFNVSTQLLPALDQAGFDILSFANNHVYDQGKKGFKETLKNLDSSNLSYIGAGDSCEAARAPRIVDINTIQVAFIGATLVLNDNENGAEDELCANFLNPDQAIASAQQAKKNGAELVVLSVHWGREYRTKPQSSHVEMAHKLMDGGIDLILGHHPHVLQPIEIYETTDHRTALALYSLGNAISNQSAWYTHNVHRPHQANTRDGVIFLVDMVRIHYGKTSQGKEQIRTELANVRAIPTWTINEIRDINGKPEPYIRVVPTHTLRDQAEAAIKNNPDELQVLELKKKIELYNTRLRQSAAILGDGFLASPKGDQ